ncbi:hypothetical protein QBC36DRAFT_296889 [Triangularia setosa]|uniref:Uncharacterized protein n=1 Tax=Triangularia setosa TaxID=2587417 RepID=A0AAN7ACE1_9PEZI|nr:hypothetical protein QBC36DRAFT_296889 [Podospora setosa]
MIGKDDPGVGTLPSKGHPPPEGSTAIVLPRSTPKRSTTPKGTLFTNLGEAHLAITARMAAKTAGQIVPTTPVNTPCESPIEPLDEPRPKNDLPLASHMDFVKSSHIVNGRCLTGYAPKVPIVGNNNEVPSQASSSPSPDPFPSSPYEEFNPDLDWVHGPGPEICSKRRPRETGSTVENIYRQYLPSEPSTAEPQSVTHSSPLIDKTHPWSLGSRHGDSNDDYYILAHSLTLSPPKLNHADDGINPGKLRRKLYDTVGDAPSVPLPDLPVAQRSTKYYPSTNSHIQGPDDPPTPSGISLSNTQVLLDRYSDDSQLAQHEGFSEEAVILEVSPDCGVDGAELEPSPRRAHEQLRQRLDRLHYACNAGPAEFSTGALTSESDEDPFKYDRKSYNVFLQPVREREVSLALHQLIGTESTTPLDENNNATNPFTSPTLFSKESGQGGLQSRNPYLNRLQSYKAPEVEDTWEGQDDPNEVKIPVQRPSSFAPALHPEPPAQNRDLTQNWRTGFYDDHFHQAQSEGGDWETVGTNVGGRFGSNLACASGTGLSGSQVIKVTGSSIADYSDCSSFGPSPYDAFTSTERILQHPTDDMNPTNQLFRNLKDTGRPVFLPKPRVHRVNGYPLDSVRHFTDATTTASGSTARSALLEKISARLRRNKEKQKRVNPFQVLPDSPVPQISDVYELENISPGHHAINKGAGASGLNKENRLTPPNQESSPIAKESPTLFSFPLITLQEAVKKQAIRRASGEDDMTLTTTRTRQDSSVLSSRATQRTTPPTPCTVKPQRYTPSTPCLAKPRPTHLRRPTGLGIPDTATTYPAYRIDKGFGGDERNLSVVSPLSSGNPAIYGRAVSPRSCRNLFGDVRANPRRNSTRSSCGFPVMLRRSTHKRKTIRGKRDMLRQPEDVPRPGPVVDPETAGAFVLSGDDAYISWDNQRKRRLFYYGALAMCVFPFLTLLIYHGAFDPLLVWWTKGEVCRMTRKQRHVVGIVGSTIAAVWLASIAVVITLLVNAKA